MQVLIWTLNICKQSKHNRHVYVVRKHLYTNTCMSVAVSQCQLLSACTKSTWDITPAEATANVLAVLYDWESVSKPIWSHCAGLSRTAEYNKIQITQRQKYKPSVGGWLGLKLANPWCANELRLQSRAAFLSWWRLTISLSYSLQFLHKQQFCLIVLNTWMKN